MTTTITTAAEVSKNTYFCVYSASEAAAKLGKSEATIRKIAKSLGVKKISGHVVSGFVKFDVQPMAVVMPFAE